jgi:glycosyltransferase involved in cell wall biosynthesis
MPRPRLLIISHDIVAAKMAGPGMRYYEMARAIQDAVVAVTLAIPNLPGQSSPSKGQSRPLDCVTYAFDRPAELRALVEALTDEVRDVVLVSSFLVDKFPFLAALKQRVVVDFYDPFVLENLYYYLDQPLSIQESLNERSVQLTNQLAQIGDFFLCGNERQRDYWLGVLTANGRVNPHTFAQDPSLHSLIDIVGIGIPDREPVRKPLLRGIHPIIPADAKIVLWGGGIWNWLDPLSLIRAWPQVLEHLPHARLIFLGVRHPNPDVPEHQMASQALQLAQETGEKDRTILFIEWLEYEEREALLLEADLGVMLQPVHLETRYSIRTRVLDYVWAELPLVISNGDITSEWVSEYHLGKTVPPSQPAETARAICELLGQPKTSFASGFKPLKEKYRWTQVVLPLVDFCLKGSKTSQSEGFSPALIPGSAGWKYRWSRARQVLQQEGWKSLIRKARRALRRRT